ncbi:hypothetical protein ACFWWT_15895 [Streptomyces sp. NPDC058676]|uniref:hypothetical protein n=1 Tax=unclassified Streptomyces TaxID=2593676 RepID=UPI0036487D33
MGIRTLHRRTAHTRAHAETASPAPLPPPVPAFAAAASTARIPGGLPTVLGRVTAAVPGGLAAPLRRATVVGTARIPAGLATAVRHAAAGTRRRLVRRERDAVGQEREAPVRRPWADPGRGYLALAVTLLPRSRLLATFTVFTAVSERPDRSAPPRPLPDRPTGGPDATP